MLPLIASLSNSFAGMSAFFFGLFLVIGFGIASLAIIVLSLTKSVFGISDRTLNGTLAGTFFVSAVLFFLVILVFVPKDECELIRRELDGEGDYEQRYQAQNCKAIEDFARSFKPGIWLVAPSIGAGIGAIAFNVFKKRSRR